MPLALLHAVRGSVQPDCVKTGVGEHHLGIRPGSRVTLSGNVEIAAQG
jgi:hypothetical protein